MPPVTYTETDPVATILDTLLTCLNDALAGVPDGVPARMELVYGTRPTIDSAPMGWVRPVRIYPSTFQLGSPDTQFVPRKQPFRWAVDVELGVIRCVPGITAEDNTPLLPSAAQITAATGTIMADARALRIAVQYLHPWRGGTLPRTWDPIGPTGGVAGGAIQITVPFSDCNPTL